jgi:hypothetical protein
MNCEWGRWVRKSWPGSQIEEAGQQDAQVGAQDEAGVGPGPFPGLDRHLDSDVRIGLAGRVSSVRHSRWAKLAVDVHIGPF